MAQVGALWTIVSISFVAAMVGTQAVAVGTLALAVRCIRGARADQIALAIALTGLTIALGAQALRYSRGFGQGTFRAVQLGGQLIAPLALAWGSSRWWRGACRPDSQHG